MSGVLLLARGDVVALMRPADYLAVVEAAFRAAKEGRARAPHPLHLGAGDGGFHAKAATFDGGRPYAAIKWNANFPRNAERCGLPTIQGAVLLCDARNGAFLAVIDSIEISKRRTAAASALAARHLARRDAWRLLICGAGEQGRAHLEAFLDAAPIVAGAVFDRDPARAQALAAEARDRHGLDVRATTDLDAAARASDVIVSCTPARAPFLSRANVMPGAFIAAVGADNPEKSEIAPDLMAAATIVVDDREQCLAMGDLRRAVAAGAVSAEDVRADLGELLVGARPGRAREDEIIVFDSTGTALQDVASAAAIFERALQRGLGTLWEIAA